MGYRFNRLELAGSLGDLGTLLPLSIGFIVGIALAYLLKSERISV